MVFDGSVSGTYLRWFLNPNAESAEIFALAGLERQNRNLLAAASVLAVALAVLGWLLIRLRKTRRQAEAATVAKGQFLANMSHEIRTPLNGIVGMTQLALGTQLTQDQRELLATVAESAEALLVIVNEVLDFEKLDAGKMALEQVPVKLGELVDSVMRSFQLQAREKALAFGADVDPACPEIIEGDPVRLRQVLYNLLGNALKFTAEGEVGLRVSPDTENGRPMVRFSVADTGIGVPPEKHGLIFEAFAQADASTTRRYGGTGLGLTIAQRLVRGMGGRLWLESRRPRGTVFHFTVPQRDGSSPG
jgi:two-component system sensor histidine kinase/response regulator